MDKSSSNQIQRKRRLSKKERKAVKKQKPQNSLAKTNNEQEDNEKIIEVNYLNSYEPIEVPSAPSADIVVDGKGTSSLIKNEHDEGGGGNEKKLGAWFPNALLVKCAVSYTNTGQLLLHGSSKEKAESIKPASNPKASLVLFYQYTKQRKWSPNEVKLLMTYLSKIAKQKNLGGRFRVAQEGVNATLSAVDMNHEEGGPTASEILRHIAQDLKNFDSSVFSETDFKYIDDLSADRHFKELKIIPVQELVYYGIREEDASCNEGGIHLDAKEYHEMLKKDNTVVVDVRNHYEAVLGRFDGQQLQQSKKEEESRSAEYIDPRMRKSTDFTTWLSKPETKQKLENKTVLMYCTGGIRCERASAYLKKEMGSEVEGIYQLKGGIERYLKAFPDGGFWRGSNFVFDKREAVSAAEKDGCGGVIRKDKKKKNQREAKSKDDDLSKCVACGVFWDRYVGKKKCFTCGVPVLLCDKCMSKKFDKTIELMLKVRCPLCMEENITVPASKVEFTDNGVKSKIGNTPDILLNKDNKNKNNTPAQKQKAAASVCKWGGGHAKQKKFARKMKQTSCRFGSECTRKDCFFSHPDRQTEKMKE